jgi:uncharacterized protein (TIGR03086 family)
VSPFFKTGPGAGGHPRFMSDYASRYERLADDFAAMVAAVPPDRWASPSPCEDWTATDVVRHVVDSHGMFLGLVGRELPPGPSPDDDPAGAFASARAAVGADMADPDRANTVFEGFFGPSTFAEAIDRFISGDLLIHRWDLGTAAGLDVRLDPAEVSRTWSGLQAMGDAVRSAGVFGPAVEAPEDADEQTRLLAFTGRAVPA